MDKKILQDSIDKAIDHKPDAVVQTFLAKTRAMDERLKDQLVIKPMSGPFKGRLYKRDPATGNLVRVYEKKG